MNEALNYRNTSERQQAGEFPLPADHLLMIDLDKTLIDASYQITDPEVFNEIARVQSLGWMLGLSSDTPLAILEKWTEYFNLNGPIIAERGAIVKIPGQEILVDESESFFSDLRQSLATRLVKEGKSFIHADSSRLVVPGVNIPNRIDNSLTLIQAYRKCGLSVYKRFIDENGHLTIDNDGILEIVDLIRELMDEPPFKIEEDINPEYGIYIASPSRVTKRMGTIALMQALNLSQIGIIGNGNSDLVGEDIAIHYAVRNSDPELLKAANFISEKHITQGVTDILSKLN